MAPSTRRPIPKILELFDLATADPLERATAVFEGPDGPPVIVIVRLHIVSTAAFDSTAAGVEPDSSELDLVTVQPADSASVYEEGAWWVSFAVLGLYIKEDFFIVVGGRTSHCWSVRQQGRACEAQIKGGRCYIIQERQRGLLDGFCSLGIVH
jgi:hypothetical protein